MGQTRKVWNLFDGKIKIIEGTMEGDDGNKADLSRVFRLDSDNKWVHNLLMLNLLNLSYVLAYFYG